MYSFLSEVLPGSLPSHLSINLSSSSPTKISPIALSIFVSAMRLKHFENRNNLYSSLRSHQLPEFLVLSTYLMRILLWKRNKIININNLTALAPKSFNFNICWWQDHRSVLSDFICIVIPSHWKVVQWLTRMGLDRWLNFRAYKSHVWDSGPFPSNPQHTHTLSEKEKR